MSLRFNTEFFARAVEFWRVYGFTEAMRLACRLLKARLVPAPYTLNGRFSLLNDPKIPAKSSSPRSVFCKPMMVLVTSGHASRAASILPEPVYEKLESAGVEIMLLHWSDGHAVIDALQLASAAVFLEPRQADLAEMAVSECERLEIPILIDQLDLPSELVLGNDFLPEIDYNLRSMGMLVINVRFFPQSIGGATVVAENLAFELAASARWRVTVLTTHLNPRAKPYSLVRYSVDGVQVLSIVVPEEGSLDYQERYNNPEILSVVDKILPLMDVDVAHMHSIQNMSFNIIDRIKARNIPLAVTVHDCWWLCERMFMVNSRNRYCGQTVVEKDVCGDCVSDIDRSEYRKKSLMESLNRADVLFFPSQFQQQLYVQNGVTTEKCIIDKNGVAYRPDNTAAARRSLPSGSDRIRFGYVGGPSIIKGAVVLRQAFEALVDSNYELLIADGAMKQGLSWSKSFDWDVKGTIRMVPPYNRYDQDSFFDRVDVLLFPSQVKESFGMTIREALIRNIWVVTTDAGGVTEDCLHGVNSDIIPMDGDYRPLLRVIRNIIRNGCPSASIPESRTRVTSISKQAENVDQILNRLVIDNESPPC